jgi:hypothetical protein
MIALALALASIQAVPITDDEIVVTAQRARNFRYRIGFEGKPRRLACKVLKSTGDKPLDALLCETARSCIPPGIDPNSKPTEEQLTLIRTCLNTGESAAVAKRASQLRAERSKS